MSAEAGTAPRPVPTPRRAPRIPATLLQNRVLGVAAFLVLLSLTFAATAPHFAQLENATTIALNASTLVVLAAAETVVVVTRNYDLSVGSTAALAAYLGLDIVRHLPPLGPVLVIVPILIGLACGVVNGAIVAYGRVPSVIATLGTMSVFRGLAFLYANGHQIDVKDLPGWVASTSAAHVLGLPVLIVIALLVVAAGSVLLRYLPLGRQIYAVGSNPAAAEFYGLRAPRIIFRAYVLCGGLTGIAAFMLAAQASWIVPYLAQGMELSALAAVVIGGVSVLGGSGTVAGAAVGALTLATIDNGLVLLGASEFVREFVQGAAIVAAVIVDALIQHRIRDLVRGLRRRRTA